MKGFVILLFFVVTQNSFAKDWWENGNFYQIYPRSFKDSDGDGIGDLNGITEKLEYLQEIGLTAVWLSPIFKSPMADFGYDISDYYQIQPEYGTMQDFQNLLEKAKRLKIKIFLDFVPNHTSDEHEWFLKSVKRESPYTDYYIWHDGIPDDGNPYGQNKPPNNWVSVFRYSAWKWNDDRKQYYLHQFLDKQPDLNYRNPDVVQKMKDVITFWLGKGIDGFRVDAIPFLFEVPLQNGGYPDEAINPDCSNPDDYCHTIHTLTLDQPETYDMVYQWRQILDKYKVDHGGDSRIMLTEAYTSLPNTIRFYGNGTHNGSHVPFNFELITNMKNDSNAVDFAQTIDSWLILLKEGYNANWVMGNHDNKRLASRFGANRADLLNILLQTLPGIAVTYYGEEIGMKDVYIPWADTVDPQACNTDSNVFHSYSRDPARTPFQWDSTNNGGFSNGPKTWLPVSTEYSRNNVKLQSEAPVSNLLAFKKLLLLRKEPSFQDGSYEKKTNGTDILIYKREYTGSDVYIVVLNFGTNTKSIDLKWHFPSLTNQVEVITTSVQSQYFDGEVVSANNFIAYPEVGTVLADVKNI